MGYGPFASLSVTDGRGSDVRGAERRTADRGATKEVSSAHALRPEADRLVWNHDVGAGRRIDQEMSATVTRKADNDVAVLLERKSRLQRSITGFILATDRLDGASAVPFRPVLSIPLVPGCTGRSHQSSKHSSQGAAPSSPESSSTSIPPARRLHARV